MGQKQSNPYIEFQFIQYIIKVYMSDFKYSPENLIAAAIYSRSEQRKAKYKRYQKLNRQILQQIYQGPTEFCLFLGAFELRTMI